MSSPAEHDDRTGIGALEADPHPVLHELRAAGPVAWVEPLDGWVVTTRTRAIEVMRDADAFTVDDPRFSTGRVIGPSMLSLDGREQARHREPFGDAFRDHAIRQRLTAFVRDTARSLVAEVAPRGAADLRDVLAGPLAARVVAELLGLPAGRADELRDWYGRIVEGVEEISAGQPLSDDARQAFAQLSEAVEASIREGRSLVADAAEDLTTEETVSNAAVILFGGIETSEGMIANLLWHVLGAPDQLARIREDRSLVPAAVEESLRLEPAATRVDRYATRDVEIDGVTIREGDLVIVSLAAANRDPDVFEDPDRFDVGRDDAPRHVTFAHGPHACIGAHLARVEAVTALETVLDRLPDLRLDEELAAPPTGLVFRKPPSVPARWTRDD